MSAVVVSRFLRGVNRPIICVIRDHQRLYCRVSRLPPRTLSRPRRAKPSGSSSQNGPSVPWAERQPSSQEEPDFYLSGTQVDGILRTNEQAVVNPEFDGRGPSAVLRFESNQLAANVPNEDRRSAATCLQTKGMLFGVFDGHGGHACAQTVSERLLYYVAVALMPQRVLEEVENAMESGRPVPPILKWHKHHSDYSYRKLTSLYVENLRVFWQELLQGEESGAGGSMGPSDALVYAFRRLDADISLEAQAAQASELMRSAAVQAAFAGSTACVAHIGAEGVHVANAGDCRAVLGVQEEDGSWSAVPLSHDHNAENERELARVRARHPKAEEGTVVQDGRLLGILMPLRAFGDVRFKWSQELQQSVLENGCDQDSLNIFQYSPANYLTPPYLDVTPEVTYHRLRPKDRFLILASDGLWDALGSEEAVRLVAEHLTGLPMRAPVSASERQVSLGQMHTLLQRRRARAMPPPDTNAATHLIRHAIGANEYGELEQERLEAMLALPDDLARMYRDDITVTIVYFNPNISKHSST
ncbi:Pyruvate dehydrogenase (acetyl-transferring)-phosphatase 2, mitochondrial-like [Scleropages formosus]|uniref:Putative pyruvate dehydrogenase phosphatase isoenzyme 2 n=1 Tax=Scleropages formosus TaxID=113540 RepID=A0A0P7ZCS1_SCLFO|nr:pyruvate dehydrogenase [acetyl-transferring]-phosphatase 2, mitochondrial [Scleropages formosus]KPP78768.1 Pyruvate dehydrogenase (acetyl-transferring)-phosphatase 2, mitochondrial-like [Scleropages formosus]